ncbi:MAG: hypothetical protein AB1730_16670 [Myxococcota bacterium]
MKTLVTMLVLALSTTAFAAPPGGKPGKWAGDPEKLQEKLEERETRTRMLFVLTVAEALELNEAEALKLSEKVKGIEEKRRPVREAMFTAMRQVKAAADGDAAALAQVDANIQKVLDGRAQMAAMDKDMFAYLAKDLTPQKKAKLALVLAKMHELRGGGMKKGRR